MVRVRVDGKIQEMNNSDEEEEESSSRSGRTTSTNSEYETDTEPTPRRPDSKIRLKKSRKRKNTRCRSQDSKHARRSKRLKRDRRCRSHDGRLPAEEGRRRDTQKRPREKPTPPTPNKKQKLLRSKNRSRSRTRSISHEEQCRYYQKKKRRTARDLYPEVSIFSLQVVGNLPIIVDLIFAKKKWLIVHLIDLAAVDKVVPADFWMRDYVISAIEGSAYVLQLSLETADGQHLVYKYRCLYREAIIVIDPVTLEKRAFWQCFPSVDVMYLELLTFLDSQTFYLQDGKKNFWPGKKGRTWPRCTEAYLLPGPSKKFDKNKVMEDSPPKTPSLSPLSDSAPIQQEPQQNEPLNLSRKNSAANVSMCSSSDEEDSIFSGSPCSQTANISGSPTMSSIEYPPTPTDDPYDPYDAEISETERDESALDPQKLVEQARSVLRGYENPEVVVPELTEEVLKMMDPDVGMGGDTNLMDEINMQRAIMQSLGLQEDLPPEPEPEPTLPPRPPSPTPQARKPFRLPPGAATFNPLEPIVEIVERITAAATAGPEAPATPTGAALTAPQKKKPKTLALLPVKNLQGKTEMQLVPMHMVRPRVKVMSNQPTTLPPNTLLPFVDNPIPAHVGDGVLAGGSAQPYALGKQYYSICFVMPWGARHYIRDLHCDNTMQDLITFLQNFLRRYKDIDWYRDIINLKMANPSRNLSKLPLKTKLRDAKLGCFPIIFVFHTQFLDRVAP